MKTCSLALIVAIFSLAPCSLAYSHETVTPLPEGTVIQAEGEAQTKVPNDYLSIDLAFEKEGAVLLELHDAIQKEAATALSKAKKIPTVSVKTSGFSIYPVHEKQRIVRHRATYQLSLESKDFTSALALAGAMQPFQVRNLAFSLSPELRKATEKTLIEDAINDLRNNVSIAANSLGAKNISIVNLTIGNRQHTPHQPQMMRGAMAMEAAAPVTAEAGEAQISITVSASALAK